MNMVRRKSIIISLLTLIIVGLFSGLLFQFSFAQEDHQMAMDDFCIENCLKNIADKKVDATLIMTGGIELVGPEPEVFQLSNLITKTPPQGFIDVLPKPDIDQLLFTQKRE